MRAEDIVDGHGEKTMTLLWMLLGKWDLEVLVNYFELRREIRRLRPVDGSGKDQSDVKEDNTGARSTENFLHMLKECPGIFARRNGLRVLDLTTSLADGKIFVGILDVYSSYLPEAVARDSPGKQCPLDARLRAIGCSSSFGKSSTNQEKTFLCTELMQHLSSNHMKEVGALVGTLTSLP